MAEVARLVPVLPVSLIATVLLDADEPIDELELKLRAGKLMAHFEANGARLYVPRGDRDYAIHVGLRMLTLRNLVEERDGIVRAGGGGAAIARLLRQFGGTLALTMLTKLWQIFLKSFFGFFTHRLSTSAAAMAFYTMFALGPIMIFSIAIAEPFVGKLMAQQAIFDALEHPRGARAPHGHPALRLGGPVPRRRPRSDHRRAGADLHRQPGVRGARRRVRRDLARRQPAPACIRCWPACNRACSRW